MCTKINKGVPRPEILRQIVKLPIKYKQTRLNWCIPLGKNIALNWFAFAVSVIAFAIVEMEQLKSHLRARRHKCQLYLTYSRRGLRFLSCVISFIVSLTLPSPSLMSGTRLWVTLRFLLQFLRFRGDFMGISNRPYKLLAIWIASKVYTPRIRAWNRSKNRQWNGLNTDSQSI